MRFRPTPIAGAFIVSIEPRSDERGFFARTWCAREFAAHGLPDVIVQSSISRSLRRGTVRGMHLQLPPSREGKLVSCARGVIYDVIVDLRPDSPSYLHHFGIELDSEPHEALFVPPLVAHGFQTLVDGTEVLYQMTDYFAPELGFGFRWNDPTFKVRWPLGESVILARDQDYPDFDARTYERRLDAARLSVEG